MSGRGGGVTLRHGARGYKELGQSANLGRVGSAC